MADTIEHSESPRTIVAEVRRLLAPGGVFVVFTPPYDTLAWLVGERIHRILTHRPADHISPFTRESLVHLLRSNFTEWEVGIVNFGLTMYGIGSSPRPE